MASASSEGSPSTPNDSLNKRLFMRSPSVSSDFQWSSFLVPKGEKKKGVFKGRDPVVIERSNLVNISKLVVKELIEQSLRYGRMLDSDHMPLQHFFIVLEHVLRHGLRPKKGLLGPKKELWDILQMVEKYAPEAQDITASVRDLPTVRTHMGRARAWLRIALMQKKIADYLKVLVDNKDEILAEYFEPDALMMSDEAIIIIGLLVGLNVVDCNLCVKEEDLDCPQGVIDFSLYLRSPINTVANIENDDHDNMTTVLDQKNYIEELNRHLNATVANLQAKVESLTTTNALMKEDLAIAKNNLLALYEENCQLKQELGRDPGGDSMTISGINQFITDRGGSKEIKSTKVSSTDEEELKQRLEEERNLRKEADHELEIQMCLKAETEVAMKLLEKDIHDKQDTITSLRRQLDDIKLINLEMYRKLQECEMELTQKGEMVTRLQVKAGQIGKILNNLEKYNHLLKDDRKPIDKEKRRSLTFGNKENIPIIGEIKARNSDIPRVTESTTVVKEGDSDTPKAIETTVGKETDSVISKATESTESKIGNSSPETSKGDSIEESKVSLSSDSTDSFVKLDLELKSPVGDEIN